MVRDGATGPRPREQLDSSAKVYNLIRDELEHADRERFVVLAVDGKGRLIGGHEVSVGSLTASLVHPRELFKALFLANAASCILAHNHPSGDPTPSPEDVALTSRLRAAGDLLGVRILDHVIVGEGRYHSMCDAGQL
jgi:DNA repair protein RadC